MPAELGILYAKYKPEKLMEHLKLFSARINIPRLIRVCIECSFVQTMGFSLDSSLAPSEPESSCSDFQMLAAARD